MQTIGVVAALHRPEAVSAARELTDWLEQRGLQVQTNEATAQAIRRPSWVRAEDLYRQADLLVVLGGDGSMVAAAREAAPFGTRIVGVNYGGFGFLSQVPPEATQAALAAILQGRFTVEERLVLQAEHWRGPHQQGRYLVINDAVIGKGPFARMLHLHVTANERYVATYQADGLILATPTGSTAYSLSAGGPILYPTLDSIVLTPICPHTLYARSLILDSHELIRVVIQSKEAMPPQEVVLSIDGQIGVDLEAEDAVTIQRTEHRFRLVTLEDQGSFFENLRRKLMWGK